MVPILKRSVVAAAILIIAACSAGPTGHVTIRNGTGETIDSLVVNVAGQTLQRSNIAAGTSVTLEFTVRGESHYDVSASLKSGKQVTASVGYVDSGYALTDDDLTVKPTSITDDTPPNRYARPT